MIQELKTKGHPSSGEKAPTSYRRASDLSEFNFNPITT